jgi:hypothetical protein
LVFNLKCKKYRVGRLIHSLVPYRTGTVKTRLPAQTKKFHICVIFHSKCFILTTFYNFHRICFSGKKSPKLATPFLALYLEISPCGNWGDIFRIEIPVLDKSPCSAQCFLWEIWVYPEICQTLRSPSLKMSLLVYDKLFILCWRFTISWEILILRWEISLTVPILVNDKYRAMNDTANHLFNDI